jgi:flagellar hook-associated protein 3 FlgL
MLRIQQEMGTGRSIFEPSEDTERADRVLRMQRGIAQNNQFQRNIEDGQGWAQAADDSLQQIVSLLNEVEALAISANNDHQNPDDRRNTAVQLDQKLEALLGMVNIQHRGRYIFGGHQTLSVPFSDTRTESGQISGAQANEETIGGRIYRRISDGEDVQINIPGDQLFQAAGGAGTNQDVFHVLATLRDTVANDNVPPEGLEDTHSNDALRDALRSIRERIVTQQSYLGSIGQRLEQAMSRLQTEEITLTEQEENAGGVDLTELVSRLATEEGAYNALLAAGPRTLRQSLVDYLL